MHINVLKPKICELVQKIIKYTKLCKTNFISEIYNIHTI